MTFKLGDFPRARLPFKGTPQGCGKEGHKSKGQAEAHMRALLRSPTVKNVERLNVYLCSCGQWHVGRKREGEA